MPQRPLPQSNKVSLLNLLTLSFIFTHHSGFEKFSVKTNTVKAKASGLQAIVSDPLFLPKIAFILLQIATMGIGLYKCGSMGLLPTSHSDWLAFLDPKEVCLWISYLKYYMIDLLFISRLWNSRVNIEDAYVM